MRAIRTAAAILIGINIGVIAGIIGLFAWLANGRLEDDADWEPDGDWNVWDDDLYDLLSIDDDFGDIEYDPIDSLFPDDDDIAEHWGEEV